jgi:hypothetical protein
VASVAPDGRPVRDVPDPASALPSVPALASSTADASALKKGAVWRGTRYEAVVDAAAGVPWPRGEAGKAGSRHWSTQLERIAELAQVTGLVSVAGETSTSRERLSRSLGIGLVELREARTAYAKAGGYRTRAEAVASTLEKVAPDARALERILRAGALAGRWGPVHFWLPGARGAAPSRQLFPGLGMPDG